MVMVRHSVRGDRGEEAVEVIARFPESGAARAHILAAISRYPDSGYDERTGRWWARHGRQLKEEHYWWLEGDGQRG